MHCTESTNVSTTLASYWNSTNTLTCEVPVSTLWMGRMRLLACEDGGTGVSMVSSGAHIVESTHELAADESNSVARSWHSKVNSENFTKARGRVQAFGMVRRCVAQECWPGNTRTCFASLPAWYRAIKLEQNVSETFRQSAKLVVVERLWRVTNLSRKSNASAARKL
jgi:hypothetical protein